MRWFVPAFALFTLLFAALSLQAQAQEAPKKCAPKEEPKKEEWLNDEAMKKLMNDVCNENWKKLKAKARSKMGADAADAADKIAESADTMLKHHKKEVREAKDYKEWAAALKKAAQDFSKAAKKSDWKEAAKHQEKISTACNDDGCHGKYRPEPEEKK